MEDDGEARQAPRNFFQDVEAQLGISAGLELICAVRGADGDGQGVTAGAFHKLLHVLRTGVGGVRSGDFYIVLDAGQGAQFRLHHYAVVMGVLNNLLGQGDVLLKGQRGTIDHDGGKATVDAGFAGLEVGAVIQMQGDGQVGIFDDGRFHQLHQISVVGVSTGALGHLEDDGRFLFAARLGDALDDLHIVDVEGTDGVTAGVGFFEHFRGSD